MYVRPKLTFVSFFYVFFCTFPLVFLGVKFWGKQEHKVSYRCSLPSPLQKRSKDQKGLHWCQNPAEDLLASTLKITRSSKTMDTCGALNSKSPLLGSGTNAILFDPWIFSAMAMAMSIYRTLCVLVFLQSANSPISLGLWFDEEEYIIFAKSNPTRGNLFHQKYHKFSTPHFSRNSAPFWSTNEVNTFHFGH